MHPSADGDIVHDVLLYRGLTSHCVVSFPAEDEELSQYGEKERVALKAGELKGHAAHMPR